MITVLISSMSLKTYNLVQTICLLLQTFGRQNTEVLPAQLLSLSDILFIKVLLTISN